MRKKDETEEKTEGETETNRKRGMGKRQRPAYDSLAAVKCNC